MTNPILQSDLTTNPCLQAQAARDLADQKLAEQQAFDAAASPGSPKQFDIGFDYALESEVMPPTKAPDRHPRKQP